MHNPLHALLSQVCQVSAQQPVQTELLMRYHQLQSRLATLKIENEEVRSCSGSCVGLMGSIEPFTRYTVGFLGCSGVESFQQQC